MLESFGQALQYFTTFGPWAVIIPGTIISLIFGIVPGINGILAMALFLPFIYYLPKEVAMPLILSLCAVAGTGGSLTAILINIPGTEANAATLLDGFPMTQKGQAGRAIGASLMASLSSDILTVGCALVIIPIILPLVMAIGSPEMVFIVLTGIVFIGVLSKGRMLKGITSGLVGLLLALVGSQAVTGVARFTFGTLYLRDGIPLIPLMLGLFGLPSVMSLVATGGSFSKVAPTIKGMGDIWEGMKDVFRHWGLWLRSSLLGFFTGIIPGVGASSAVFIAYGQAKVSSKHPEEFGTGTVKGVIAPESANNAKEAGALLTTLALGIPSSSSMAILLAALLILGYTPGPLMLKEHMDLTLILFLTLIVAHVVGILILLGSVRYIIKLAYIPGRIMFPLITAISFVGAYAYRGQLLDVLLLIIFAALGIAIKKWGYNGPALLLGFILGGLFEKYILISLNAAGPLFFVRPICLVLIALIIFLLIYSPVISLFQRNKASVVSDTPKGDEKG